MRNVIKATIDITSQNTDVESCRKSLLNFQKDKEKEIKQLLKTMDIISEFIDNAL